MAQSPEEITHGFVLNGADLVFSMLQGERDPATGQITASKHIENRRGRMAPGYYAVSLGKSDGETPERRRMCQDALPTMALPSRNSLGVQAMIGCTVGIAKIEHSLPYTKCEGDPWKNDMGTCNIVSQVGWFEQYIPVRGNLGCFPIKDERALAAVRAQAAGATLFETRGAAIYDKRHSWTAKRKRVGPIDLDDPEEREQLRSFLAKAITENRRRIEAAEREASQDL